MADPEFRSEVSVKRQSSSTGRRRSLTVAAMLLTICAAAFAQTPLTGTWSGTYSYSVSPSGCNQTFASNGNVAVTFLQNDTSLSGTMVLSDLQMFTGNCTTTKGDFPDALQGNVSGSALSWRLLNDADFTQFTATRSGETISATLTDAVGGTGTLTLNRTAGTTPAVDSSGSWSGTYSFTDQCSNGVQQKYSGAMSIGVLQTGAAYTGVLTMAGVPLYDQNCSKLATETLTLSSAGSVSASTLTGSMFDPAGSFEFPVSITTDGTTMTGTVSGASQTNTTGTFTLTRSSSQRPDTTFTGTYSGNYQEIDNVAPFCLNLGSLTFGGAASVSAIQAGNAISGTLTVEDSLNAVQDGFGGCGVVNVGEVVLPLYGTLSGGSLILVVPQGGGVVNNYNVTFSSSSVAGTVSDSFGDILSFSTTKSTPAPVVTAFSVTPASIVSGQTATLSWSTANAVSVSIDNGVGTQGASGSVTVKPSTTTVYTLTATGAAGTVTAQTTVTVSPVPPRRRVARE